MKKEILVTGEFRHSKREKPTVLYDEILQHLSEFGDLLFGTVSKSAIFKAVQHRLPSGELKLKEGRVYCTGKILCGKYYVHTTLSGSSLPKRSVQD